jgi:hypothetical protein
MALGESFVFASGNATAATGAGAGTLTLVTGACGASGFETETFSVGSVCFGCESDATVGIAAGFCRFR